MSEPQFDLDVVLSLFDGISCGQEALKRAGLSTRIFLASEIEKYPKMITRKNHPLTVQLGCVKTVKGENLPKVDLILAGSPCTGFSFAGKGLAFDDPRSALFFEFVRVLEECRKFNPDVKFLLENVKMKQEFQDIISEHLGVEPVMINSALVSAQSRKRLYWTNIPGVTQPKDKGIVLKDILEESPEDYTLMSDKFVNRNKDAGCLIDSDKPKASNLSAMEYVKNGRQGDYIKSDKKGRPCELKDFNKNALCHHAATATDVNGHDSLKRVYADSGKSPTLNTMGGGNREPKVLFIPEKVRVRKHEVDIEGLQYCLLKALENSKKTKKQVAEELNDKFSTVEHYFRKVGSEFFSIPSEHHWFELKEILNIETNEFDASITEFEIRDGRYDMADRVYNPEYKAPTVVASNVSKVLCDRIVGRKINPDLKAEQRLEPRLDEKTSTLTTVQKDNVVVNRNILDEVIHAEVKKLLKGSKYENNFKWKWDTAGRILVMRPDGMKIQRIGRLAFPDNKTEIVTAVTQPHTTYRKLSVLECSRLQTLPDSYLQDCFDDKGKEISNTQKYKALGNGWTVDVIVHLLQGLKQRVAA